ncbi:MAG: 2-C-methyl-D-erythritol 2,4-cyclodiphosphate synthase [Cyanobacteria bacterium]|nr:2-C-methyl-D-erythritol 2,4-cyclodiphosphate synthase [Cyanobacteriota bacterium]
MTESKHIQHNTQGRIGQGFDLHRLVPEKRLLLGGVLIESSPRGSDAHSDGDVLLHALIDAVLGALGQGDIGDHFPPSDAQWKDADSLLLLQQVLDQILKPSGYCLVNIDTTVFLETPKLTPYKLGIREKLASTLQLPLDAVSFKAKTMEGLGPIGHGEAIAASVTVLLSPV